MASFQQATRSHYQTAYGADFGAADLGGFYLMPNGELISFNTVKKEYILLITGGKPVKTTYTRMFDAQYSLARRTGRKIGTDEAKRMQEDAGRKYKTAAVRVNDKLLYKTWKAPKVDATVEVTPSWIKATYNKDHTAHGVTYKAGKQVVIKNDDPRYRQWADELNAAYMTGKLTLARSATSADDAEMRRTAKAKLPKKLLGQTWNDGTYTYKVGNDGSVSVKNKTWTPGKGTYDTVAKQLNVMDSEGRLKSGALKSSAELDEAGVKEMKADLTMSETGEKGTGDEEPTPDTAVASSSASGEKVEIREGKGASGGMTDSPYFWPAVGAGALALGLGGYFMLRKKG